MRKRFTLLTILGLLTMLALAQPKHEVRAVWLTTIGGIDWPKSYAHAGMGISGQQRELSGMLDRLKDAGINTILLQTRVRATTIYPSDIEPWDGCLSGGPGESPGYDALQFAIDECHKRGLELHAWVVTIPVGKWNSYGCQRLRRLYGRLIRKIGDEGYMNPESPITADYIAGICEEIATRYDVDGIHLDYIRYPETWRGAKDKENITRIVRQVHHRVKRFKPWVKMSCSPIGKYDNLSRYSARGWNALTRVAQDPQQWLREGLMDQLYPMMYFAGNNFYPFALDWQEQSAGRTVVSGLAAYMLDPREGTWQLSELQRQLNVTRQIGMGHCYFRAKFLLDNTKGIYDYASRFDCQPALTPPMTWSGWACPTPPTAFSVAHRTDGDHLSWGKATDYSNGPYLTYNVYASTTTPVDIANPANLIATRLMQTTLQIPPRRVAGMHAQPLHYAVTAMDRYGNESPQADEDDRRPGHSAMIPNDGNRLLLQHLPKDAPYIVVCSLQGTVLKTFAYRSVIDVSQLPAGIYQLKSLGKKGVTHRMGFFIVRNDKR